MKRKLKEIVKRISVNLKQYRLNKIDIVNIVCVTIIAFLLSYYLVVDLSNIASYVATSSVSDIEMSDIYNAIADRRPVRYLNDKIVVVSSDSCNRDEIATLMARLNSYDVKAVGLDLFYRETNPSDTAFLEAVGEKGNVVLSYMLYEDEYGKVLPICSETFNKAVNVQSGYVNFLKSDKSGVVRSFKPIMKKGKESFNSLALAVATTGDSTMVYDYDACEAELIYFPSIEFEVIDGKDVINSNNDELLETLKDKYVIVGDTQIENDSFLTPVSKKIAGVLIHAYALNTILGKLEISVTPLWLCWIISIFVCFAFIAASVWVSKWNDVFKGMIMRLIQILMLYLFIIIGTKLFVNENVYFDFSSTILIVAFGLIANDIWMGVCELVRIIFKKKK